MLPVIADRGLGLLPYFPLASGLLTGKYRRGQPLPAGSRLARNAGHASDFISEHNWRLVEALTVFSKRHGRSLIELAFGWLLSHAEVTSVIAGATSPEQVAQNVRAANWRLSPGMLTEVDRITQQVA